MQCEAKLYDEEGNPALECHCQKYRGHSGPHLYVGGLLQLGRLWYDKPALQVIARIG